MTALSTTILHFYTAHLGCPDAAAVLMAHLLNTMEN